MIDHNKLGILGAGSWSTALALLLAQNGFSVDVWSRRADLVEQVSQDMENKRYLPGIPIPDRVSFTNDLELVVRGSMAVVFCVPSHAFRTTLRLALPLLDRETLVINAAKGIEVESLLRMSEVFQKETGPQPVRGYVALSGPSHAEEVGKGIPTAVVVASANLDASRLAQDIFMSKYFRVYTNPDIVGVELGGALKNIIALGTGICDGLGFGDNTGAAFMTRGLAEITRLGIAQGANPLTFAGLAGVGDLIVTCTSRHSRNRRAGYEIGKGKTMEEAVKSVQMVVEGIRTTRAARGLADKSKVEMPITEQMYQVLFEGLDPCTAVGRLMSRGRTHEMEEVALARGYWCAD